ncbi:MAG: STAS/SEC14 domain-containing protein [Pseudomonadota bacterium]
MSHIFPDTLETAMISVSPLEDHGILEVRMDPPVSAEDYKSVLVPAIDHAIADADRVRLLVIVSAGFSDFTLGAMFEDTHVGLKHWKGFDRIAVASDNRAMKHAIRAFSVFLPCPVSMFEMDQVEAARRWLRESLGSIQQDDLGEGILHLSLRGKLDSEAYENNIEDLNRFLAAHDDPRLLIDIRDFDGWQGLGALKDHFDLVRSHAPRISRAAVLGDAGWQEMALQIGKRAFALDARFFKAGEFDAAQDWLRR